MNKTKLFFTAAIAMAMTAACSNEEFMTPAGNDGNVTFTVSLPSNGMASRAFADGLSAKNLQVAVYDIDGTFVTETSASFGANSLSTTVSLNLANGREYKIAFFAQNGGTTGNENVYTFDASAKTVTVDYSKMTAYNSSDYDCFYNTTTTGKVNSPINQTITLNRPVAQINWGTNDLNNGTVVSMYGENAENLKTSVEMKGVANTLNLFDGSISSATGFTGEVALNALVRPTGENFPVQNYSYLSMQYVLVPTSSSVIDLKLNSYVGTGTESKCELNVTNAPVQANYRTNIYGSLLTSSANFQVTKEPNYVGINNEVYDGDSFRVANSLVQAQDLLAAGEERVSLDGSMLTPSVFSTRSGDASVVSFLLNKRVRSQKLKITGEANASIKVSYEGGSSEIQNPEFELVVTKKLAGVEIDLSGASVTVTSKPEAGVTEVHVESLAVTNASNASIKVPATNLNYDDKVQIKDVVVVDADQFVQAIAKGQNITVPSGRTIDITEKGAVTVNNDIELIVDGDIKTARQVDVANIIVAQGKTLKIKGGNFKADNRIIDVHGNLIVDGSSFETSTKNRGAALTVYETGNVTFNSGDITAANCAMWVEGKVTINDGNIVSTNSSKDPEVGNGWSYAVRLLKTTADVTVNGGKIQGTQGALAVVYGKLVVNDGEIHTRPRVTDSDNFYALYIGDGEGSHTTINGGVFYSHNKPSVYFEEEYVGYEKCTLVKKGGKFNNKGKVARYVKVNGKNVWQYEDETKPAEGYKWIDIDDEHLNHEVVKL